MFTKGDEMKKKQKIDWRRRLKFLLKILTLHQRYSNRFIALCLCVTEKELDELYRGKRRFTATVTKRIKAMERHHFVPIRIRRDILDKPDSAAKAPTFSHENYLDLLYRIARERSIRYQDSDEDNEWDDRSLFRFRGRHMRPDRRPDSLRDHGYERTLERWRARHRDDIRRFPHEEAIEQRKLSEDERWILIALMSEDRGMYENEGRLSAAILLKMVASDRRELLAKRNLLVEDAPLRKLNLIRPGKEESSFFSFLSGDGSAFLRQSFELTSSARELLFGPLLEKAVRHKEKSAYARIEHPRYGLDGVILPEDHRRRLEEVLAQARDGGTLFDRWGLSKTIHYGKGTLLLFQGPPGTGKTMTAGALAHELGRPLLVADFGKIESCWVGETEKNMIALFQEAKEKDAALFIDEADGLLATREMATRSWEIRDVNVLLQELERFEGVVILATNNVSVLDPALESRCALRLRFPMPGPAERERIFRAHLPPEYSLGPDVDLRLLAERYPLSGRTIKNVILGAARRALASRRDAVAMSDLLSACEAEMGNDNDHALIGFHVTASEESATSPIP